MNTNQKTINIISAIVAILVVAGLGVFWYVKNLPGGITGPVACTQEAKQCPDGSYVGRTGPHCEFAQCPSAGTSTAAIPAPAQITVTAALNQSVGGLGVNITPLKVLQDSRCAVDVQCIQAGTVEVSVALRTQGLGNTTTILTLNKPFATVDETIELVSVTPDKIAGKTIAASEYRFTFSITTHQNPADVKG
jgi:hypothetical protein